MRVNVVVPCLDDGRLVESTLRALLVQQPSETRIVVADLGSTDLFTRQVLARLPTGAEVLPCPAGARGSALNHAIRTMPADLFGIVPPGLEVSPGLLPRALARFSANPALDLLLAPSPGSPLSGASMPLSKATLLSAYPLRAAWFFPRKTWERCDGFDAGVEDYEDLDFWLRAFERSLTAELLGSDGTSAPCLDVDRLAKNHVSAMAAVYRKHVPTSEDDLVALLLGREAAIYRFREHRRSMPPAPTQATGDASGLVQALRGVPVSRHWGFDRGTPIDRRYIEEFLERNRQDVRGRVLEVRDAQYTRHFGGGAVEHSDVLDVDVRNREATIVADLARADSIPSASFDCFILTQTLHIIFDFRGALGHALRILKPGGVLLLTLPCLSRVNDENGGLDGGDFWRFTEAAARRLLAEVLPKGSFSVESRGNAAVAVAYFAGLAVEDLPHDFFDTEDPWFPLLLCVRAVKPGSVGTQP